MATTKKNMSISLQLTLLVTVPILICAFCVGTIAMSLFYRQFLRNDAQNLIHTAHGVYHTLEDWTNALTGNAEILASHPEILEQTRNARLRPSNALNDVIHEKADILGLDYIAVVGTNGIIIASNKLPVGTNMSSVPIVQHAINNHEDSFAYDTMADAPYAIMVSHPIIEDGTLLGVILVGYDLVNGEFLTITNDNYNVDCTVFQGDTRVATTLHGANGKSLVGTKLTNKAIVDQVLKRGEQYNGFNIIAGLKYSTIYMPLKSDNGDITGMIFVAKSMTPLIAIRNKTIMIVAIFSIIMVSIFLITGLGQTRWLMNRIAKVTRFLKELSSGKADLTQRIKLARNDEIGDLVTNFNAFCDKLQKIVAEIKHSETDLSKAGNNMGKSSAETTEHIGQIISSINDIHSQMGEQSTKVRNTAAAVSDMTSNIQSLEQITYDQSKTVAQANDAIDHMIGSINSVNQSIEKMATSFSELERNANEGIQTQADVNDKINQIESQSEMLQEANATINHIASQTNLLAMNAAIEAAHAGEAGKGFAVVADEIRKLSETSAAQSKTIGQQLGNIRASINDVVNASNISGQAFATVSDNIKDTTKLIAEIRSAMDQQNTGNLQIGEALKAMSQIRDAAKEMADGNAEILQSIQSLQDNTELMINGIDEMKSDASLISEVSNSLSSISDTVEDSIDTIGKQINQFTV